MKIQFKLFGKFCFGEICLDEIWGCQVDNLHQFGGKLNFKPRSAGNLKKSKIKFKLKLLAHNLLDAY